MTWAAIGAAHLDRIARSEGPVALASSNPASVTASPGGVARNVAETLARLGSPVRLLSRVGADEAGGAVVESARNAGVDVSGIEVVAGAPTAGYTALLDPAGRLVVAFADMAIYDGFDGAGLACRAVGCERWFVETNIPPDALADLAGRKPVDTFLAADAVSVAKSERLRPILPAIDLLFVNRDEARALTGTGEAREAATRLRTAGIDTVVVTLGADGILVAGPAGQKSLKAVPANICDVTGAGDALIAATLDGLGRGAAMMTSIRLGLVAAAATLGYEGAVRPDIAAAVATEAGHQPEVP